LLIIIIIHVLLCIGLALTVLLQAGKGGGLSGAFGGAGAQTILGQRGAATFLSKLTRWLAISYMVLSLSLAFLYASPTRRGTAEPTPVEGETEEPTEAAPIVTEEPSAETDGDGQPAPETE